MKILITRSLNNPSIYLNTLPKGTVLNAISFIQIKHLPFKVPHDIKWIFFSSKNSFDAYISQHSIHKNVRIGCVSEGTQKYINDHGHTVDYVGKPDASLEDNARNFSKMVDGKVLFPSSDRTLSTFTQFLDPEQVVERVAYQTILHPETLNTEFDYYCFTSPSNVKSFFKENEIPKGARCVVIGSSTKDELENYVQPEVIYSSKETSIDSMLEEVKLLMEAL